MAVCLPHEAETVGLLRSVVKNALVSLGVTEECVDGIVLALSEAATNIVDHAVPDDEYEVRVQVDDENCAISVKNTGPGFDAGALHDVMPDASSARGRGVGIMRAIMDQVDLRSEPEAGTIVYLVKALSVDPDGALARLRRKRRAVE